MPPDPLNTAGLVTREVHTDARDGVTTRIALARRTFGTGQDDLWSAVTDPERIARWFLPVTGDLRVGGHYQLEGNAAGRVERCDEPDTFEVTWEFAGQVSWLRVTLTPAVDGTTLELRHEAPVDPAFWSQYGPGAVGIGWDLGLLALGLHVESDEPLDPGFADDWAMTPPGIAFVQEAAGGWAAAAVDDGDEPDAAQEAAERTVTFYTVAPEE